MGRLGGHRYGRVWWVGPVSYPLAVGCEGLVGGTSESPSCCRV